MPQLKIPFADSALKPLVDQFIVTVHDCTIIVSRAYGFTRNRGLGFGPIIAVTARDGVRGIGRTVRDYQDPDFTHIRQRADVLAACPTFIEAVTAAYTFFEAESEAEVPAA